MVSVVWWTCALFALASARIYDRCEFARELYRHGIDPENIPTWVCIAYHESRLDTTANNPYSGDHGIFQISELYWCGAGKACGATCDKFRDEDITDDIDCVLQIHEEHSRFQSNGFMAWVVYPQYCTHNAKKYVVDCDYQSKDAPVNKLRSRFEFDQYNQSRSFDRPRVEGLLPPYLAVSAFFRGQYGRVIDYNMEPRKNLVNYKLDNIDELKLPVLGQFSLPGPSFVVPPSLTTTTTTAKTLTTTYVPRVKTWRYIESNQFRKRKKSDQKNKTTSDIIQSDDDRKVVSTAATTTHSTSTTITKAPTEATLKTTTLSPWNSWKSWTSSSTPSTISKTNSNSVNFWTTPLNPLKVTTTTTLKPWTNSWVWTTSSTPSTSSTNAPSTSWTLRPWRTLTNNFATTKKPYVPVTRSTVSRSATTTLSQTINTQSSTTKTTIQPVTSSKTFTRGFVRFVEHSTTTKPLTTTARSITTNNAASVSTTQSIFDLYLNPARQPRVSSYIFPSNNNQIKLTIFSDGTTTHKPQYSRGGAAKNQVRREAMLLF